MLINCSGEKWGEGGGEGGENIPERKVGRSAGAQRFLQKE